MTATAHEGQKEDRERRGERTLIKQRPVCQRSRDARDTALRARITVKLDPEAGLHVAQEHSLSPKPWSVRRDDATSQPDPAGQPRLTGNTVTRS